jgi:hypothetical protein
MKPYQHIEKPTSNQDFFDKAWNWLVVEKRPKSMSEESDSCRYRLDLGDETLACVAGAFIPDALYVECIEGGAIDGVCTSKCTNPSRYDEKIAKLFEYVDMKVAREVQECHDYNSVSGRYAKMIALAKKYNLTIPKCQNAKIHNHNSRQ